MLIKIFKDNTPLNIKKEKKIKQSDLKNGLKILVGIFPKKTLR